MDMTTQRKSDPALYAELSKPFPSREEADAALTAFQADMQELRKRHRIGNLYLVTLVHFQMPGGKEDAVIGYAALGDDRYALPLVAYAYGREKATQKALEDEALAQGAASIRAEATPQPEGKQA
jgi:hypothetical protein